MAAEIGISGAKDDMAAVFPYHDGLMEPLDLDEHSAGVLLDSYRRRRSLLNGKLHCLMGRARVAVLSRDRGWRKGCDYSGAVCGDVPARPSIRRQSRWPSAAPYRVFEYCPGLWVDHFRVDSAGRISGVVASARDGPFPSPPLARLLAAGTQYPARIFLESLYRDCGKTPELHGVMDNRQILMPFVNLRMLGRPRNPETYQYHQVAMAIRMNTGEMIHGLVSLKTALIHPLVQTLLGSSNLGLPGYP